MICVKALNLRALDKVIESKWIGVAEQGFSPKASWRSLYKKPTEQRLGDFQWGIVHWAIATNRYKAHLDSLHSVVCNFCGKSETVNHLFVECSRLSQLFWVLKDDCQRLGFLFTNGLFIFGPKYSATNIQKVVLLNFIFGIAKMAFWLTRKNKTLNLSGVDPVHMLKGFIKGRLMLEFAYYEMINDIETFFLCVGNRRCVV